MACAVESVNLNTKYAGGGGGRGVRCVTTGSHSIEKQNKTKTRDLVGVKKGFSTEWRLGTSHRFFYMVMKKGAAMSQMSQRHL